MTTIAKIWLMFCINRALGIVGPILMTYGVTVSDNTAELLAGAIITTVQVWMSHRNLKNAIKANPKEESQDKAGSVAVSIVALSLIPFLYGCAHYKELPSSATPEQKSVARLEDIRSTLSNPAVQATAELFIAQGGKYTVSTLKDSIDREAVKKQLRAWGSTVNSLLSTGHPITAEQLEGIFDTFQSRLDANKFSTQFSTATAPIHGYIEKISELGDLRIAREWATLLARAAITAGS